MAVNPGLACVSVRHPHLKTSVDVQPHAYAAEVKGNDQVDILVGKATITNGFRLENPC